MSINKSIRGSRRTRRSLASGGGDLIGPYIYCINFYDNGLSAVRDEFVKRLESGLRRAMFVIDLDKEVAEANYQFQRKSRTKKAGELYGIQLFGEGFQNVAF